MSFIAWIVLGLVAGFIASKLVNKAGVPRAVSTARLRDRQGGGLAGFNGRSTDRRSSHIT
jgi:hypothetical protein